MSDIGFRQNQKKPAFILDLNILLIYIHIYIPAPTHCSRSTYLIWFIVFRCRRVGIKLVNKSMNVARLTTAAQIQIRTDQS